ncbi:ZIP zinc transporter-domain-containing protein [Obelidium mucronatum]|nr:ZIP zinc transporter-domain-containing protein [Obelidium mucronatum]
MGPFVYLLGLCAAMFSGAFLAGSIPLAFAFSESRLVLVSTFGSGLLLGTAFSVILPEGVETLYSASAAQKAPHHTEHHVSTVSSSSSNNVPQIKSWDTSNSNSNGNNKDVEVDIDLEEDEVIREVVKQISGGGGEGESTKAKGINTPVPIDNQSGTAGKSTDNEKHVIPLPTTNGDRSNSGSIAEPNKDAPKPIQPPPTDTYGKQGIHSPSTNDTNSKKRRSVDKDAGDNVAVVEKDDHSASHGHQHHNEESHAHYEPQKYIGPSLALGFLLMLLIDQLGIGGHGHNHSTQTHSQSSTRKNSAELPHHHSNCGGAAEEKGELMGSQSGSSSGSDGIRLAGTSSATLGLVVHAAADGIALGAALSSDASSLGFIVFLAIMLHKAPSAFGLSTHLLKTLDPRGGISTRARIRSQLFLFSIAAPIGAILTYCILIQLGFEDANAMRIYTGSALLFSAGTFLYAATVHVLPEIYNEEGKLSRGQTIALVLGMFLPYFMMVEHSH